MREREKEQRDRSSETILDDITHEKEHMEDEKGLRK